MTTIDIDLTYPGGQPRGYQTALVSLIHGGSGGSDGTKVIGDTQRIPLDPDGHTSIDLVPNADITPAGTFYRLSIPGAQPSVVRHIEVPDSPTPVSWADPAIQVESPVPPDFVNVVEATAAETLATAGPAIAQDAADAAVTALPELDAGPVIEGISLDTSTPGLIRIAGAALRPAAVPVASTTTETTVLASPVSVTLDAEQIVRVTFGCLLVNSTGVDQTFTIRCKVGPLTATFTTPPLPSSATPRVALLDATWTTTTFLGTLVGSGSGRLSISDAGTGVDVASITRAVGLAALGAGPHALDLTVQPSASSGSLSATTTALVLQRLVST